LPVIFFRLFFELADKYFLNQQTRNCLCIMIDK
jgi:hypothetical protein